VNSTESVSIWLAAEYSFATTYSIREPGTSATFAKCCPLPGPGTVKLALLKMSIELYGKDITQRTIFPLVNKMNVLIRPPQSVSISGQFLHRIKNDFRNSGGVQSMSVREHAQAMDSLHIYIECLEKEEAVISNLMSMIGYWGEGDSLAQCNCIKLANPITEECARKLDTIAPFGLRGYELCYLTNLRSNITWHDVIAGKGIYLSLYVLPMTVTKQSRNSRTLMFNKLPTNTKVPM
jgi:hypothetical protein